MNKILTIALLLFSVMAMAQNNGNSSLDSVYIYSKTEVTVEPANKVEVLPVPEEPKAPSIEFNYDFPAVSYKPRAVYSPIDPVFLKPEKGEDYFDNYVEIGFGNYLTTYLDARIHNTVDKYYTYGLSVQHHAASSSKNPSQALFSQNRIRAFGMRERGNTLSGEIDYQRNVVHYYGYMDSAEYELKDINQIYNDVNANLHWDTRKGGFDSDVDLDFNIFDKLQGKEFTVALENENKFRAGRGYFNLDLGGMFTSLDQGGNYNRTFIDVYPHFEFKVKKVDFDAGLLLTTFIDSNTSVFRPAARIKATTYLVPDKLRAFLGIDGGLQKNTMRDVSYENLFLGNNLEIRSPYEMLQLYVGMNGNFKRFVEYGLKMSQSFMRDQYLFVTDTNTFRNMQLVYDDFNVFTFTGELKLDINDNLDIGFVGKFYSYSGNTEDAAWQLPTYDVKVFATIRMMDKIYLTGSYYGISSRPAIDFAQNRNTLGAINDVNVGMEYRYKKNISGFINIQNLLNQRYQLWNHYRAQGFNLLAGVTFSL
ncbi:TonB-dependent receptor [bacterium]|nr:TonB-dependent receptor [bacterium]